MERNVRRTLALAMIARDAARTIARALDSVAPYVDRMVVLDTGSLDDTADVAESRGAEVTSFAWRDDFGAAKSAALAVADADWNLVLDSDEWLQAGGEALARLRADSRPFVGVVRHVNYESFHHSLPAFAFNAVRILPRGVRFMYRIHEQPEHDLRSWVSPLVIGHDGYEPTLIPAKAERNLRLLRWEHDDDPQNPYIAFKYAEELRRAGGHREACQLFDFAYRADLRRVPWRHGLVLAYIGALGDAGDYEKCLAVAGEVMDEWPDSPDVSFVLGNVLLDFALARPELANQLLPMIESAYLHCLEIGDRPNIEHSHLGHGSFLAARNLYAYYESLGNAQQAENYRKLECKLRSAAHAATRV